MDVRGAMTPTFLRPPAARLFQAVLFLLDNTTPLLDGLPEPKLREPLSNFVEERCISIIWQSYWRQGHDSPTA